MSEELNNIENNDQDYIQVIKDLKENTVSREQYMKLKAENKKLIQNLVEGSGEVSGAPAPKVDVNQLRRDLFNVDGSLTNLAYIDKALQLREALIEKGDKDPFLPWGKQISPTDTDISTANKVASVLQECVDYADGNPSVFQSELMRVLEDTPAVYRRRR